ncbi:MAG: DUF2341 domain-containing protein, partial [Parcubacteria group bacterium]|nr:DUF2341 domain-containing protein [Parcubacteria group bacterium]
MDNGTVKGMSPLLAIIFVLALSIASVTIALRLVTPIIGKAREQSALDQAESNLLAINSAVRELKNEGQGASRSVSIDSKYTNEYRIDPLFNEVVFEMESRYGILPSNSTFNQGPLSFDTTGSYRVQVNASSWLNNSFSNRFLVTILSSQIPSSLSDYPVFFNLSSAPSSFWTNVRSDGADVMVTLAAGNQTELNCQLVGIDRTSRLGELWIRMNISSSSNTSFYIYHNNPSESSSHCNDASTWSSFRSVYHLQEGSNPINDVQGFSYRKPITVAASTALTDYQTLITNPVYNETGLVGSWHLNEGSGTSAKDSSGQLNDGTLTNGPTWTTGKYGNGLSFDGVNDYVGMGAISNSFISSRFTISGWFKSNATAGGEIFKMQANAQSDTGMYVNDAARKMGCNAWPSAGINSITSVTDNSWHFGTCVYDGANLTLYVDGVRENSSSISTPGTSASAGWNIGRHNAGTSFFNGSIDDVRIYNRALSAAEVSSLYNATARPDYEDIRFTASDGVSLLPYWMESDGRFWVKSNLSSGANTLYMYYGNPSASSLSNGQSTFDFFDDFDDGTINSTKWQDTTGFTESNGYLSGSSTSYRIRSANSWTGNYILETMQKTDSEASNGHMAGGWYASSSNSYGFLLHPTNSIYTRNDGTWVCACSFAYVGYWAK